MRQLPILIIILFLWINSVAQEKINNNAVIIPKGQSRSFMLTNYRATFFFSETGGQNTLDFQGLNVETNEFLEDYILEANGKILKREAVDAYLYPNKLIRNYEDLELNEEINLVDSLSVLIIKLSSKKKLSISLVPLISGESQSKNFVTFWMEENKSLYIAHKNHLVRTERENYPVWTCVYTHPNSEFLNLDSNLLKIYVGLKKEMFLPGKLNFLLDGTAYIFFIIGDDKEDVLKKQKQVLREFNIFIEKSGKKIDGIRKT